jgi:hypothetical protein
MVSEAKRGTVSGGKGRHCRGWSFLAACGHSLLPSGAAKDAFLIAIGLSAAMAGVARSVEGTLGGRDAPLVHIDYNAGQRSGGI